MSLPTPPTQSLIHIKSRFEGMHSWPLAPAEVEFLRQPHRHEFHVEIHLGVQELDRELEFILVKRWLEDGPIKQLKQEMFYPKMGETFTKSCEAMAEFIGTELQKFYGNRYTAVGVFEDGENGGIAIWNV